MGIDPDVQVMIDALNAEMAELVTKHNVLNDALASLVAAPSVEVQSAAGAFVVALNARILGLDNPASMELLTQLTATLAPPADTA